ncbi:serine/threonine protein kinase [Perkinsela sp. CCAP 1560/4]|nr:serine/threonine protein kinase [Perkinsela sp. CCAP 1560/4]|eukprot:KNH07456.1 serine/threonine protein kinase [Perkinsela sp. CCAP 1560/4]
MDTISSDCQPSVHLEGYLYTHTFLIRRKVWCELRGEYLLIFPHATRRNKGARAIPLDHARLIYSEGQSHFALEEHLRATPQVEVFHADRTVIQRWVTSLRSVLLGAGGQSPVERQSSTARPIDEPSRSAPTVDRLKSFLFDTIPPRNIAKVCAPSVGGPQQLIDRLKTLQLMGKKQPEMVEVGIDDFRIVRLLGEGTHGTVYQVEHKVSGATYALKLISKDHIKRPSSFFIELYVLRTLRHPFVVRLATAFQTEQYVGVLLNYLPNGTLQKRLFRSSRIPLREARIYAAQILLGIEYLHDRGIVYRDLKPENVVLDEHNACVLTDMSLARRNTLCFTICGTPLYVAPEVLLRDGYTKDIDWWSFGVVLYEMIVGVTPFVAETTDAIFEKILTRDVRFPYGMHLPREATDLIRSLLRKNPVNRLTNPRDIRMHPFFAGICWETLIRSSAGATREDV